MSCTAGNEVLYMGLLPLTEPGFVGRLAYLSCIFVKLNALNLSLQLGDNTDILALNDKNQRITRKVELWTARVEMGIAYVF